MSFSSAERASFGSRPRLLAGRSLSRPACAGRRRAARVPKEACFAFFGGGEVSGRYSSTLPDFRLLVWSYWKKHGRHDLPWRRTRDPYKILVSEIMLQQTQVSRVREKYPEFLEVFPDVRALAAASLSDVLRVWIGLGYNRRAKFLHEAAQEIVRVHGGRVPKDSAALRALPGVGEYTAAAVRAFAYGIPETLVETNIRTAITHHFFSAHRQKVHDADVRRIAKRLASAQRQRDWHAALMDYGAHLKANGVRMNQRSAHYTRQKAFKGSLREVRGAILRELHKKKPTLGTLSFAKSRVRLALTALARDGLIHKEGGRWHL